MRFSFYPEHEYACPNVGHCPHPGGAALGTHVLKANAAGDTLDCLYRTLDGERRRISELVEENQHLEKELAQAKLELKLERQSKLATNTQKKHDSADSDSEDDWLVEVSSPASCPPCHGHVTAVRGVDPVDHLQEDNTNNVYRVVCYRMKPPAAPTVADRFSSPAAPNFSGVGSAHICVVFRSCSERLRSAIATMRTRNECRL